MPKRITKTFLKKHRACEKQVTLFAKLFPRGALLTEENILRAAHAGVSVSWLAQFLPGPAQRSYEEATAAAWRSYEEATAAAWRSYEEATAAAWRSYEEARAPALVPHLPHLISL